MQIKALWNTCTVALNCIISTHIPLPDDL